MQLVHLSEENLNNKIISPRIPDNFLVKNGYEDNATPRVCFTTYVEYALRAMSSNIKAKVFYVHVPDKEYPIVKPTIEQVPDAEVTQERWILEPVKLRVVGKIRVLRPKPSRGIIYRYGNNHAELYDWEYGSMPAPEIQINPRVSYKMIKSIMGNFTKQDMMYLYYGNPYYNDPHVFYRDIEYYKGDKGKRYGAYIEIKRYFDDIDYGIVVIGAEPEARGKGLTDILVKRAIDRLRGTPCKYLIWRADKTNIASQKLATRLGFKVLDIDDKDIKYQYDIIQ